MYSIVMLTALSTAPDAPQFNGYFRDLFSGGCNGCSGAARYSCNGCSGSMAYSNSCNGCCGGGSVFGLGLGDRVRSFFERDPIGYGCCGGRSYGCSGSSLSCSGYSCFGCGAMSYTPMSGAGLSCNGGTYAVPQPGFDQFPPMPNVRPAPGVPNIPYAIPDSAPGGAFRASPQPNGALAATGATARATVIVRVPADARLSADGRALNLTGTERKFVSPDLPQDQEFVYKFTAEYERDGETVAVTKKVAVRAGVTSSVTFADPAAPRSSDAPGSTTSTTPAKGAVPTSEPAKAAPPAPKPAPVAEPNPATERATITVKLPADATLYVDDRKSPSREPVRSFATPPLPAGREFAYVIKAEVIRNGQPETVTQKVPFRAGERVVVDFTSLGK